MCEALWKDYRSAATSKLSAAPPFDVGENALHPLLRLVRTQNLHPETFFDAMAWLLASHPAAPTIRFRKWLSGRTGFNFRTVEGSAAARRCALGRIGVANAKLLDAATMRQDIRCSLEQLEAILREVWDAWSQHASTLPSAKHDP